MSGDRHAAPGQQPQPSGAGGITAPDVLVVCTANVARSPLLALRLQREADRRLGPGQAVVGSAGTEARFGDAAAPGSRRVAERWASTLDGHRAQPTMYVPLDRVPLILAMTRRHVRALSARVPGVATSAFSVMEFVGCLERIGSAHQSAGAPPTSRHELRARLEFVARLANSHRLAYPRLRRGLDVPDPIGGDQATYDRLGDRFAAAADALADALFGPLPD